MVPVHLVVAERAGLVLVGSRFDRLEPQGDEVSDYVVRVLREAEEGVSDFWSFRQLCEFSGCLLTQSGSEVTFLDLPHDFIVGSFEKCSLRLRKGFIVDTR